MIKQGTSSRRVLCKVHLNGLLYLSTKYFSLAFTNREKTFTKRFFRSFFKSSQQKKNASYFTFLIFFIHSVSLISRLYLINWISALGYLELMKLRKYSLSPNITNKATFMRFETLFLCVAFTHYKDLLNSRFIQYYFVSRS